MDTNQVILAVATAVLVVFSLTVAIVVPKRNPEFPGRKLLLFVGVSAVLVVGMLLTVGFFGGEDAEEVPEATSTEAPAEGGSGEAPPAESGASAETGAPAEAAGAGDPAAGKAIFDSAGCSGCHTLADAGASGNVGPNLDEAKPPYDLVIERVTNGAGAMPAFAGQLSEQQIQDVASYVVQATAS